MDNYSNIYDILGNYHEWTTEYSTCTYDDNIMPCIWREAFIFTMYILQAYVALVIMGM